RVTIDLPTFTGNYADYLILVRLSLVSRFTYFFFFFNYPPCVFAHRTTRTRTTAHDARAGVPQDDRGRARRAGDPVRVLAEHPGQRVALREGRRHGDLQQAHAPLQAPLPAPLPLRQR